MINLLELADVLDKAERQGEKCRGVPEGALFITISDTLAKQISEQLREYVELTDRSIEVPISSCVCGGSGFYDNGYHKLSYCHLCRQGEIERLRACK